MVKTCETQDTLVLNSGIAKRHAWQGPGPPKCLLFPATYSLQNRDTLMEQSNVLLKQYLLCK